jgi:hypothetical protein
MSKSYSKAGMKVREIELKMIRNLMAVECDVRMCVSLVYYIDRVYNIVEQNKERQPTLQVSW